MNANDWFSAEVARAVETAWRLMMADPTTRVYLWHRRGGLTVAAEQPEGYELSENQAVPSHRERAHVAGWILERARRLPCLPVEG